MTLPHQTAAAIGLAMLMASNPAIAAHEPGNDLHTRAWMLQHLGPNGLAKCRAFRAVLRHTSELQKTGGGTISPVERRRLEAELRSAKAMTPRRVSAFDCGVPL